jgi:RNA polymerase sigma-70 factor (ECF subfamily)
MDQQAHITDETLARRAAAGERTAFDAIVRRYCRPLVQFVAGRTGSVQDAEDIVQETLLRAYQHIGSFDSRYAFKSWLFTIAYRMSVSAHRRKRPAVMEQEALCRLGQATAPDPCDGEELWAVVRALKPDDYTVLWLRYKQGMDMGQIAKVMHKTTTGVRVHLHRARNRLAEKMGLSEAAAPVPGCRIEGEVLMERTK